MGTLLTTEEVATRVRTSPATVRYWQHVGTGPRSFKVGRRRLYDEADVTAWLEAAKGRRVRCKLTRKLLSRPVLGLTRTNTDKVDPASLRRVVSALCELSASAGEPMRRKVARQIILGHLSVGRTPEEVMRYARNALGIKDPTGETAAYLADRR